MPRRSTTIGQPGSSVRLLLGVGCRLGFRNRFRLGLVLLPGRSGALAQRVDPPVAEPLQLHARPLQVDLRDVEHSLEEIEPREIQVRLIQGQQRGVRVGCLAVGRRVVTLGHGQAFDGDGPFEEPEVDVLQVGGEAGLAHGAPADRPRDHVGERHANYDRHAHQCGEDDPDLADAAGGSAAGAGGFGRIALFD